MKYKLCISEIHLGRYRLELLDENNQVINGTDGGSALIIMWLNDMIFAREHAQYIVDQRRSSDDIGAEAIAAICSAATPEQRKALNDLNAKRLARQTKLIAEAFGSKINPDR